MQVYPYNESDPCGPKRTHEGTCEQGVSGLQSGSNVCEN